MKYEKPGCAYCPDTMRFCREGTAAERGPGWCPSKIGPETAEAGLEACREDEFTGRVLRESSIIEGSGHGRLTRLEEVVMFAERMGFRKLGIASCVSFLDYAYTLSGVLESHGFEVVSVCCKNGAADKEDIGIPLDSRDRKVPGHFEALCNPIGQAEALNRAGSEFNVVLGLCVGHDSLFNRHSAALTTTLIAKDRVLAHNPVGVFLLANTVYSRIWGPDRPAKPPKKPAEGRK